ncbi:MAG: lamin tail domain-containing protein [Candidatus Peribacteraceae bacterium]
MRRSTLLAAAVFLLILAFAARTYAATAVISEVLWSGSDLSSSDEWLEIVCVEDDSGSVLDLEGWSLGSLDGAGDEKTLFTFPPLSFFAAGELAVIARYHASDSRLSDEPRYLASSLSLSNTKLLLRLRDAFGVIRDEVDDGVGAPFAGSNSSPKASMERMDLLAPGTVKDNWVTASVSCGFDESEVVLGSPGFALGTCSGSSSSFTSSSSESSSSSEALSSDSSSSSDSSASSSVFFPSSYGSSSLPSPSSSSGSSLSASSSFSENDTSSEGASSDSSAVSSSEGWRVFINEVLPNPVGLDELSWVEIMNAGTSSSDLSGLTLKCGSSKFTFPSATVLAPGAFISFRKTQTKLALPDGGGTVWLLSGATILDTLGYPELPDGVSYGRDPAFLSSTFAYCSPTEGTNNDQADWSPELSIQSGNTRDVGSVVINVEVVEPVNVFGTMRCRVDFGDGTGSESCNPASHTYHSPGNYTLSASIGGYCGTTVIRTIDIDVLEEEDEEDETTFKTATYNSDGQKLYSSSSSESSSSQSLVQTSPSTLTCTPSFTIVPLISELLPNPFGPDADGEWIELTNRSDQPLSLCGYSLATASSKTRRFPLDALLISPRGFLVLPHDATKLGLTNSKDAVRLFRRSGSGEVLIQEVPYDHVKEGRSFARADDDSFAWVSLPTPGTANEIDDLNKTMAQEITLASGLGSKSSAKKVATKSASKSSKKSTAKTKTTAKKLSVARGATAADERLLASLSDTDEVPSQSGGTWLLMLNVLLVGTAGIGAAYVRWKFFGS